MEKVYYVYILFSQRNGTLYLGVANDLVRRVFEHKNKLVEGFSCKYDVDKLGYFEEYASIADAIKREKQLKPWKREWKLELVEKFNPDWRDLYVDINN